MVDSRDECHDRNYKTAFCFEGRCGHSHHGHQAGMFDQRQANFFVSTGGSLARFSLPEGKTVRIITVVAGGHNAVKHVEKAKEFAAAVTARKLDDLHAAHREWWKTYWSKSSIAINDEELEKFYYGALYVLGCSSREGSIPPGLAGPWHLHGPVCWSNKYTLDYNFEAQWWGVYSSNRAELAMPYYDVDLETHTGGTAVGPGEWHKRCLVWRQRPCLGRLYGHQDT